MYLTPFMHRTQVWSVILCIALSAFIFNTTEFIPVGLLPNIAQSFDISVTKAGLIITLYAWAVSLLSLPFTVITAKLERKKLLITLFSIFIISHFICAIAWDFVSLMIGRIGIACAHAIFWAIATPLAVRLAPNGKRAQAIGFIVAGSSMATVLGVPIGTLIGQIVGWRITFLCIAIIAFVVLLLLVYLLPKTPSNNKISLHDIPKLFKRPSLTHVYLLTVIIVTGHFTAYTYITPFMHSVGGFDASFATVLLFCIGLAGILGSIIFAKFSEKSPKQFFIFTLILLMFSLFIFHLFIFHVYSIIFQCLIWGISITLFGMIMQTKVLEAAPDGTDIAMSIYSGIYNIGIGGGAFIGGQVVLYFSLDKIGYIGGLFVLLALIIFIIFYARHWIIKTS